MKYEIFEMLFPEGDVRLKKLKEFNHQNTSLEVGTAVLKKGSRMPDAGTSTYPRREISFILEGELETDVDGDTRILKQGDIVSIAPDSHQHSKVLADTRLIYLFYGNR